MYQFCVCIYIYIYINYIYIYISVIYIYIYAARQPGSQAARQPGSQPASQPARGPGEKPMVKPAANQKQINTPLKADHPERPTITLGWSIEHLPGILTNNVYLLDFMVSRSGWHRNRGVLIYSQAKRAPRGAALGWASRAHSRPAHKGYSWLISNWAHF